MTAEQLATQADANETLLGQAEMGVVLQEVYQTAVTLDPRLEDVKIVPVEPGTGPIAFARPAHRSESGQHEVHFQLEDIDSVLAKHQKLLDSVPGLNEIMADKMMTTPENVTAESLIAFSLAHEFGHVVLNMDNEDNPEALTQLIKQDKAAMPLGNVATSRLLDTSTAEHADLVNNLDAHKARLGASSFEEVIEMQHFAYRNTTAEHAADTFAADLFATNPTLADRMIAPGAIDRYRDFPAAA